MPEAPVAQATPAATPAPAVVSPPPVARRFELPEEITPQPAKPPAAPAESVTPAVDAQKPPTADEATATDPEDKPEAVTPEQAAKREGRRFERRLDKAYRQRAEAVARAELLEKQLTEARATPQAKPAEGEPKLADFDYDPEKYATAKAEFATKKAEKELSEKQRTASQQAEHKRLVSAWETKADRAEDKYDDFREVVGDLTPNSPFVAAIMEADNGEDIAYHLGKNPKEAERIAKLPPLAQVREIGKLEAKLAATPEKPKTPSKAPAPITPLTGAAPVASQEPSEQDDMKAWMRKRQKQVHGRT